MLKSRLTKDEHAALPEAVQSHYKAEGDAFVLDAEGTVSRADLDAANQKVIEFRNNNQALNAKAIELDALKAKYKDVDPAEYERVKGELEALKTKGITKPDDITTKVQAAVTAAVKPLSDKLADAERQRQESDTALQVSRLRSGLTTSALENKANKKAVSVIVDRAMSVFDMDEHGALKAKEGHFSADKPAEPITIKEWMTSQAKGDLDYAFESSRGGGAGESGGGTPPNTATQVTTRDPAELGKHLEDLASGKSELG